MVARDDPELKALLEKFVTVRCVQMGGVDLGMFQFDPMLSWSVFFLHGDGTIYSRYGSAHEDAKRAKKDSNTNHSVAGLKATMRRVLDAHEAFATMTPEIRQGGFAAKRGAPWPWKHAEQTPAARKHGRLKRLGPGDTDTKGCVHCHEVQRLLLDSYTMTDRSIPDAMLWMYPHPEWVGITMDRDAASRVMRVAEDSPAAKAGLKAGDVILIFDQQQVHSPADVTWVLHGQPEVGGRLALQVVRPDEDDRLRTLEMTLPKDWRRLHDFAWRYRIAGYAMWTWAGATLLDHADGVRIARHAPRWFKQDNKDARKVLKPGDVILAVDGRSTFSEHWQLPWTRSAYLAYLVREKKPGAQVTLDLRRGGEKLTVRFRVPKPRPAWLGH